MNTNLFTFMVPKGTKVLNEESHLVTLLDDAYVEGYLQEDGGYIYTVSGKQYYVSSGCIKPTYGIVW